MSENPLAAIHGTLSGAKNVRIAAKPIAGEVVDASWRSSGPARTPITDARMIFVYNGQENPLTGWYVDSHGHRLFLLAGRLAPICPFQGPGIARWRLVREAATVQPDAA